MFTGLIASLMEDSPRFSGATLPFVGFLVTVSAFLGSYYNPTIASQLVIVSGLIIFLPGISIILSLQELSTRNLISGTARFTGTTVELVKMAFGVLLGTQVIKNLGYFSVNAVHAEYHPMWMYAVLLLLAPAVAIIFNAKIKDIKWIIAASFIGFMSTKWGVEHLGVKLGYIIPGFCLSVYSNFIARLLDQPASITIIPGMYYMVPGSVGFKTVQSLLFDRYDDFLSSAVSLLFISISLVAGLSFGYILVPPRRSL